MKYAIYKRNGVETEISADDVGQVSLLARFKCPACEEPVVHIRSENISDHFRHKSGYASEACELYVAGTSVAGGQYGSSSYVSNDKLDDFYIKIKIRQANPEFFFCFFLDEQQIVDYENANVSLLLAPHDTNLESYLSNTKFDTYSITRSRFLPNKENELPLDKLTSKYKIRVGFESDTIDFLADINFFTTSAEELDWVNQGELTGKKVENARVYVEDTYICVSKKSIKSLHGFNVNDKVIKCADGFFAYFVSITEQAHQTVMFLGQHGFELFEKVDASLLWPPSLRLDGLQVIHGDKAYIFSNFLINESNTDNLIYEEVSPKLYRFRIDEDVLIKQENYVFQWFKGTHSDKHIETSPVEKISLDMYTAQIEKAYLLSGSGIEKISDGDSIKLFAGREIKEYFSNYIQRHIMPNINAVSDGDPINEILKYVKYEESFTADMLVYNGNNMFVLDYIQKCVRKKRINGFVKRLLLEGKL